MITPFVSEFLYYRESDNRNKQSRNNRDSAKNDCPKKPIYSHIKIPKIALKTRKKNDNNKQATQKCNKHWSLVLTTASKLMCGGQIHIQQVKVELVRIIFNYVYKRRRVHTHEYLCTELLTNEFCSKDDSIDWNELPNKANRFKTSISSEICVQRFIDDIARSASNQEHSSNSSTSWPSCLLFFFFFSQNRQFFFDNILFNKWIHVEQ